MGCGGSKTAKPQKPQAPVAKPQPEPKHQTLQDAKIKQTAQKVPISMPIPRQQPSKIVQSQVYPQSNIAKQESKQKYQPRQQVQSFLPPINEEEDVVHDEGVSVFAVPIKNINLQVEVR